jgi:hypothetical protein
VQRDSEEACNVFGDADGMIGCHVYLENSSNCLDLSFLEDNLNPGK